MSSEMPAAPDPLLDELDRLAIEVVGMTALALAELDSGHDLTLPQWRALVVVAAADGSRMSEVADRLGMSRPSTSRLLRRLQRKGLVQSTPDPSDGRASVLTATDEGARILTRTRASRRAMVRAALARHGSRPPGHLAAGIGAIADALADG